MPRLTPVGMATNEIVSPLDPIAERSDHRHYVLRAAQHLFERVLVLLANHDREISLMRDSVPRPGDGHFRNFRRGIDRV